MKRIFTILVVMSCLVSCESFVELDAPKTQIVNSALFANDAGAKSAIAGVYSQLMSAAGFASGGNSGVTVIAGLSADELINHSTSPVRVSIYNNSLTPVNTVTSAWTEPFKTIYQVNSILEAVQTSTGITKPVRDQVTGEALFVRAFCYFYLVNFFGDVPLLLTTDYRANRVALRTPKTEVYQQIEQDLIEAQKLLTDDYSFSNGEKVRPNKWVANALLARTYLYQEKWAAAETQASAIIGSGQFSLPDLNSVFLANSDEAIWQLKPVLPRINTFDGPYFFGEYGIIEVTASPSVLDWFEAGDNRAASWIANYTGDDQTYDYAYKYKVVYADQPLTEYQMVFRLAEQYLIRAEARVQLEDFSGAIDDVNEVRVRAGLDPLDISMMSDEEVADAVVQERKVELFIEWGHRWFDLKRTGKIDEVLGAVKTGWQPNDALFPIPQSEIRANPNLSQNP